MVIWSPDKRKKIIYHFAALLEQFSAWAGSGQVELAFDTVQELKNIDEITDYNAFIKGQKIEFKLLEQPLRRHYYCRPPLPIRKKNIPISFFQSLTSFACILAFKMVSSGSNSLATGLGVKKSVDELRVNMDSFLLVYFEFDFSSQTYVQ